MSFFSPPTPPDPTATSNKQAQYNLQAGQQQNQVNSYNQVNPTGTQTYVSDPNSPSGYTLNQSLSAPYQSLFNTNTGAVNAMADNSASRYSAPFDAFGATGQLANTLNQWQGQYLKPIFQQQQSNTDAQLQNQGITPGSTAYNNAENLLARNQGDVTNQYLSMNEPQAYNQIMQNYYQPLQTEQSLLGITPGTPKFGQTPTAQVQPPNYQQAAQNNFQNNQTQFQNTMQGAGQLAGGFANMAGMFLL